MSDWQVGDLALCVDAQPQEGEFLHDPTLAVGRVYTVAGAYVHGGSDDRCPYGLTLVEITPPGGKLGYCEDRFRKIRPDEREACEPEFVTLLKRSKRKVAA